MVCSCFFFWIVSFSCEAVAPNRYPLHFVEQEGAGAGDLAKENAILKRAVQIQSTRLAEQGEKEKDVAKLREALAQYEQEIRALQISNYSLSVHLKQAQETGSVVNKNHNPDVY